MMKNLTYLVTSRNILRLHLFLSLTKKFANEKIIFNSEEPVFIANLKKGITRQSPVSVLRSYLEYMRILGGYLPVRASGSNPFFMAFCLSCCFCLSLSSINFITTIANIRGSGLSL